MITAIALGATSIIARLSKLLQMSIIDLEADLPAIERPIDRDPELVEGPRPARGHHRRPHTIA
jgi:hypothetical protein